MAATVAQQSADPTFLKPAVAVTASDLSPKTPERKKDTRPTTPLTPPPTARKLAPHAPDSKQSWNDTCASSLGEYLSTVTIPSAARHLNDPSQWNGGSRRLSMVDHAGPAVVGDGQIDITTSASRRGSVMSPPNSREGSPASSAEIKNSLRNLSEDRGLSWLTDERWTPVDVNDCDIVGSLDFGVDLDYLDNSIPLDAIPIQEHMEFGLEIFDDVMLWSDDKTSKPANTPDDKASATNTTAEKQSKPTTTKALRPTKKRKSYSPEVFHPVSMTDTAPTNAKKARPVKRAKSAKTSTKKVTAAQKAEMELVSFFSAVALDASDSPRAKTAIPAQFRRPNSWVSPTRRRKVPYVASSVAASKTFIRNLF